MNITRDTFLDFYIDLSHSGYPLDYYTRQFSYYLKVDWLIYHEDLKDNINITRKKKSTFYWMKECKQMNLGRWQDVKIIGLKIYIIRKSFKEDFYCGIAIFIKKGVLFSHTNKGGKWPGNW